MMCCYLNVQFQGQGVNLSYNFIEAKNFYKTNKMKAVCVTRIRNDGNLIQMTHNFIKF